jgi:hypothetical protein
MGQSFEISFLPMTMPWFLTKPKKTFDRHFMSSTYFVNADELAQVMCSLGFS